jgi:hypothetical protein
LLPPAFKSKELLALGIIKNIRSQYTQTLPACRLIGAKPMKLVSFCSWLVR